MLGLAWQVGHDILYQRMKQLCLQLLKLQPERIRDTTSIIPQNYTIPLIYFTSICKLLEKPYTHHTHLIHTPYTHHTHTIHTPYTHHTHTIHTPYTHHTHTIHTPYTPSPPSVLGISGVSAVGRFNNQLSHLSKIPFESLSPLPGGLT